MKQQQYELDPASLKDFLGLKPYYQKVLREPIPPRLTELVKRLRAKEAEIVNSNE